MKVIPSLFSGGVGFHQDLMGEHLAYGLPSNHEEQELYLSHGGCEVQVQCLQKHHLLQCCYDCSLSGGHYGFDVHDESCAYYDHACDLRAHLGDVQVVLDLFSEVLVELVLVIQILVGEVLVIEDLADEGLVEYNRVVSEDQVELDQSKLLLPIHSEDDQYFH